MRIKKISFFIALMLLFSFVIVVGCSSNGDDSQAGNDASSSQNESKEADTSQEEIIKVGMIVSQVRNDGAFSQTQYEALQVLEKQDGIETIWAEKVADADGERVMRQMINDGADLIISCSYGFMDATHKLAQEYPDRYFLNCSGYKTAPNMSVYWGKIQEAQFLTGYMMGKMTKTNKIGFVAPFPIPLIKSVVNGFALGVQKANPDAEVYVMWTDSWTDAAKEQEAAKSLIEIGVDCISHHQNTPAVITEAAAAGIWTVGYNVDQKHFAPEYVLTSNVYDWSPFYLAAVEQIRTNTWESSDMLWGIKEGVIKQTPLSDKVPEDIRKEIQEIHDEFARGERFVFTGPVYTQTGELVVPEGETMDMKVARTQEWLVNNIVN